MIENTQRFHELRDYFGTLEQGTQDRILALLQQRIPQNSVPAWKLSLLAGKCYLLPRDVATAQIARLYKEAQLPAEWPPGDESLAPEEAYERACEVLEIASLPSRNEQFEKDSIAFPLLQPSDQVEVLTALAAAQEQMIEAANALANLSQASERPRTIAITNKRPLPLVVQEYILKEKLYLLYSNKARERISQGFGIHIGETALNSSYQASGTHGVRWPGRNYIAKRITAEDARAQVVAHFNSGGASHKA